MDARHDLQKCFILTGRCTESIKLAFYEFLKGQSISSSNDTLVASKGLFDRFKTIFSLHKVSFSRDKVSADHKAAALFLTQLNNLIKEKDYSCGQIFNYNELDCVDKNAITHAFNEK